MGFKIPNLKNFKIPDFNLPDINLPEFDFPDIPNIENTKDIDANKILGYIKEQSPELGGTIDEFVSLTDVSSMMPDMNSVMPDMSNITSELSNVSTSINSEQLTTSLEIPSISTDQFSDLGIDVGDIDMSSINIDTSFDSSDLQSELNNIDVDSYMEDIDMDSMMAELDMSNMMKQMLPFSNSNGNFNINSIIDSINNLTPDDVSSLLKQGINRYVDNKKRRIMFFINETKAFVSYIDFDELNFDGMDSIMSNDYKGILKKAAKGYIYEKLDNIDSMMDFSSIMNDVNMNNILGDMDLSSLSNTIDMSSITTDMNSSSMNIDLNNIDIPEELDGFTMPTIEKPSIEIPNMDTSQFTTNMDMSQMMSEMPNMSNMINEMNMEDMKIGSKIKSKIEPYFN